MGKSDKLITVIVPVYNGEKYLPHTIESILRSSHSKLELLIIDDGSTDKSAQICKKYMKNDSRIRYVYQKNAGIVSARNKGLELSQGDYVGFCDQDDIVNSRMYEILIDKVEKENADIGVCGTGRLINGEVTPYEKITDDILNTEGIKNKLIYPILFRGYDYDFLTSKNYIYGTIWKCIFNRSFLLKNKIHFQYFLSHEDDWIFITEALSHAKRAVTSGYMGYLWRVNDKSYSHSRGYIKDIFGKLSKFDEYTNIYLHSCIIDKKIFKEYSRVSLCEHFVEIYANAAAIKNRALRKEYRSQAKSYMELNNYKANLCCSRRLSGSAFRRKLVFKSLETLGVMPTFAVSRIIDFAEKCMGRVKWITLLERKAKGIGRRQEETDEAHNTDSLL